MGKAALSRRRKQHSSWPDESVVEVLELSDTDRPSTSPANYGPSRTSSLSPSRRPISGILSQPNITRSSSSSSRTSSLSPSSRRPISRSLSSSSIQSKITRSWSSSSFQCIPLPQGPDDPYFFDVKSTRHAESEPPPHSTRIEKLIKSATLEDKTSFQTAVSEFQQDLSSEFCESMERLNLRDRSCGGSGAVRITRSLSPTLEGGSQAYFQKLAMPREEQRRRALARSLRVDLTRYSLVSCQAGSCTVRGSISLRGVR
jgi:hypothetical protein